MDFLVDNLPKIVGAITITFLGGLVVFLVRTILRSAWRKFGERLPGVVAWPAKIVFVEILVLLSYFVVVLVLGVFGVSMNSISVIVFGLLVPVMLVSVIALLVGTTIYGVRLLKPAPQGLGS